MNKHSPAPIQAMSLFYVEYGFFYIISTLVNNSLMVKPWNREQHFLKIFYTP